MSGFYGADTDQLRRHSELLRSRARSLGELRERLHPAVADESIWQGGDADAFRTRWTSQTAPLFDDLVGQLTRQAGDTERHADEQDEASGPEGSEAVLAAGAVPAGAEVAVVTPPRTGSRSGSSSPMAARSGTRSRVCGTAARRSWT